MIDLEKQSIIQFDVWAKDFDRKRFLPFYFSNKAISNVVDPKNGETILDIGCGTGILLDQLSKTMNNLKLYGLDISSEMVKVAMSKLGDKAIITQGTADALPYPDKFFNCVTCATSFHHYQNPEKSIREMFRVLIPSGKLIILDPCIDGYLRKQICSVLNKISKERDTNLFEKQQMAKMFENAGFENILQKSFLFYKLITMGIKPKEDINVVAKNV